MSKTNSILNWLRKGAGESTRERECEAKKPTRPNFLRRCSKISEEVVAKGLVEVVVAEGLVEEITTEAIV